MYLTCYRFSSKEITERTTTMLKSKQANTGLRKRCENNHGTEVLVLGFKIRSDKINAIKTVICISLLTNLSFLKIVKLKVFSRLS